MTATDGSTEPPSATVRETPTGDPADVGRSPIVDSDAPPTWLLSSGTALAVALVYAAGLGAFHLLDVDEPRFATASRTMLEKGDWIVPYFNGEVRYDKPVLIYWLQAPLMWLFGAVEGAARLPSALGIALGAAATVGMGRTIGLRPVAAVGAGLILATTGVAQAIGHGATADGVLLGLTAATCWLLMHRACSSATKTCPGYAMMLGLLLGLCFLDKGPAAFVTPFALWIGIVRGGRGPTWGESLMAAGAATAVVLAWGIPALIQTDGGFLTEGLGHHVVARSTSGFEGHGGFAPQWYLFYVVAIPAAFLPWSAFWRGTWAVVRMPEIAGLRSVDVKALCTAIVLTFAVFTLVTSKLAHYPLPSFPMLALLTAAGLAAGVGAGRRQAIGGTVLAVLAVALGIGLPVFFVATGLELPQSVLVAGAIALIGLGTASVRMFRGRVREAALATLCTLLTFWPFASAFVLPTFTVQTVAERVVELAGDVEAERPLRLYQLTMPTASFYLHRDVPRVRAVLTDEGTLVRTPEHETLRLLESGAVVLTRGSRLAWLQSAVDELSDGPQRARLSAAIATPHSRIDAFLTSKGKVIDLVRLELPANGTGD